MTEKETDLNLNSFNLLLGSRGIELNFIGHKQAKEFESFSKFVMGLKFRCLMKKIPLDENYLKEILSDANIDITKDQFRRIQRKLKEVIPSYIENPAPTNLRHISRKYPEFKK